MSVTESVAEGMRTLLARRDEELAHGATAVGWKIGLNGSAVQQLFGLDGPVVGYLLSPTVIDPGEPIVVGQWAKPALEVEIAIRVGADGQVAGIAPALELVDLGDFFDDIGSMLAANICHRGVVFGPELTGFDQPGPDITALQVRVESAAGVELATGALVEVPAITVRVVHDFLAAHGATLTADDRIIAGSLISPLPVSSGDSLTVCFGRLGELKVSFA